MTHGSLFSGIGGFDLAAEWMGWSNAFHCEINPFGQKILKHYWPDATSYSGITRTDFTGWNGRIDILTGGFPCQPFSTAGKQLGTDDPRHLWPEFLRVIREVRPAWVVGENVRGLVSWDGGLVFHQVQADLEAEGYNVLPVLLPAAGVNAPHQRYRIWFIAYSENNRHECGQDGDQRDAEQFYQDKRRWDEAHGCEPIRCGGVAADAYSAGPQKRHAANITIEQGHPTRGNASGWSQFPTQPPVCDGNDGLPSGLDGIAFSKWRNESIKGGGNAIVPQVAYQIFRTIELFELLY